MGKDHDLLHDAAPAYDDVEARRARAGVAAALFSSSKDEEQPERVAVGRYEIDSRLGAGGMGVVYRAHDPDLDRPVAVKLLHDDSSTDEKARARMLREARALAKLSHPNVITVYDVGTDEGRVFVAMELVMGRDLRRWLEQHREASWREVLALFIAAGRGLAAAHERALVHRDFKPENVLVGDDGRVRVLDFGLARLHRPIEPASDAQGTPALSLSRTDDPANRDECTASIAQLPTSAFSGGLTETGALIGTPLYMAPELYAGKPADERSDQFAFSASLYEGLYRQLPFGERTLAAHVDALAKGRVIAPPEDSPVPLAVWKLVARGLEPDPGGRHPNMGSLLDALERVVAEPSTTELPRRGGRGRLLAFAGGAALVLLGLMGREVGWFGREAEGGQARAGVVEGDARGPTPALETGRQTAAELEPAPEPELALEPEPEVEAAVNSEPEPAVNSEPEAEPEPAPTPPREHSSEQHGWCHLHEDHLTLLERTTSRRAQLQHQGRCYRCRVERRRSRWRSFSPRDCAGYSLCGPVPEEECK